MADLKPIYLVHGDDNAKIDSWRLRLRKRAEAEHGAGGLDMFDATGTSADAVAAELSALTFATGTRYLLVDNVEAWKAADAEPLIAALTPMPPDTVLLLLIRGKQPLKGILKAVEAAGGEVIACAGPKPWEIPAWVADRAKEHGIVLNGEAARTLIGIVGTGQQRLAREIEKIAIAIHPDTRAGADEVEQYAAGETAPKVYDLADAVVAGDRDTALRLAEEITRDEEPSRLVYPIVSRLRETLRAVEQLDAGMSEGEIGKTMKPPWKAKKLLPLARQADRATLQRAICRFADLEFNLRGGSRGGAVSLEEHIAVTLTLVRAAA